MTTNQKIRKIVAGRMSVEISRTMPADTGKFGKKYPHKFVRCFFHGKIGKTIPAAMRETSDALIAAGIPPRNGTDFHSGHFVNEISFFIPANF